MAMNDIKDTVLTFVTKQAMVKRVEGKEFDVVSKRTIQATKLQEGDTVLAVHAASEQAHIVLASENSFFLRFPLSEIPFKKKTAVGVRGMKLSEGDLLSNVYWLEGDNSTEVEFHDRVVHINRLRIGARDGKGTKQK